VTGGRSKLFGAMLALVFLVNFPRVAFAPMLDAFADAFTVRSQGKVGLIATLAKYTVFYVAALVALGQLGIATEVVATDELDERVSELAGDIAEGPTSALGNTMRLLSESYDRSLEEQLAAETDTIARATQTTDYERGFAAFFGDDDPEFTGQ